MTTAQPVRLLGITGSLRAKSFNTAALRTFAALLPAGVALEIADLADIPFYNADVEQGGLPEAVKALRSRVTAADGLVFAVPEYNFSVPGVLKNALEWLSRPPSPPCHGKPCAMLGATLSPLGTARGQFHLRHICVSLNLIPVNTPHVDITSAAAKFDPEGKLTDSASIDAIRQLAGELITLTRSLSVRHGSN